MEAQTFRLGLGAGRPFKGHGLLSGRLDEQGGRAVIEGGDEGVAVLEARLPQSEVERLQLH